MKNSLLLPACVVLSLGAGYAGHKFAGDPAAQASAPALDQTLERLAGELAGLHQQQLELQQELASLRGATLSSGSRLSVDELGSAVESYLASRADLPAARAAASDMPATPRLPAKASPDGELPADDELFALLRGSDLGSMEKQELWKKISAAGRSDALIALYEAWAAEDPQNPDRQTELGQAYVQKIQEVGGGPLAGMWATKAEKAWDRALEIDPQHWEARFSKAISLSFWPPIFGKQPEAIRQFETLVAQQDGQPLSEKHAQTYLMLGNLYAQNGQADKAAETWKQGASLYPNDSSLAEKLK